MSLSDEVGGMKLSAMCLILSCKSTIELTPPHSFIHKIMMIYGYYICINEPLESFELPFSPKCPSGLKLQWL